MLITDSIESEYLDNAHYDIVCAFPRAYAGLDSIVITGGSGLTPSIIADGELKTPEFSLTCIVTATQDRMLQELYEATVHPGYVDMRYPVGVTWGPPTHRLRRECYLKSYVPPDRVEYRSASILEVTLTLRSI